MTPAQLLEQCERAEALKLEYVFLIVTRSRWPRTDSTIILPRVVGRCKAVFGKPVAEPRPHKYLVEVKTAELRAWCEANAPDSA